VRYVIKITRRHRSCFQNITAIARRHSTVLQGYPCATSKKNRACVVTYRHSGDSVVRKLPSASPKRKQFMNLFWAFARNMTGPRRFESVHRFKTLRLCQKIGADLLSAKLFFAALGYESFSLRETRLDVSLRTFAAPTALETSAD